MLDALGNIGDFLGGIGVVVTLAYLALQIRQNTTVVRTSNFQELLIAFNAFPSKVAASDELADLYIRGMASFHALSEKEKIRFSMLLSEAFTIAQLSYQQHARGLLDDVLNKNFQSSTSRLFLAPGVAEWWETAKHWLHPDFREHVDREIAPAAQQSVADGPPTARSN